jgi:hypothetical protein
MRAGEGIPPRSGRLSEACAMLSLLSGMLASENRPLQFTDSLRELESAHRDTGPPTDPPPPTPSAQAPG